MAHRYTLVNISSETEIEKDLGEGVSQGVYYHPNISRAAFLEVINNWNRIALLQSKVSGKVDWLYIALD